MKKYSRRSKVSLPRDSLHAVILRICKTIFVKFAMRLVLFGCNGSFKRYCRAALSLSLSLTLFFSLSLSLSLSLSDSLSISYSLSLSVTITLSLLLTISYFLSPSLLLSLSLSLSIHNTDGITYSLLLLFFNLFLLIQ